MDDLKNKNECKWSKMRFYKLKPKVDGKLFQLSMIEYRHGTSKAIFLRRILQITLSVTKL